MAQMNRVYSKKLEDALLQGKTIDEAHKIAMADPEANPTAKQVANAKAWLLEHQTKKRLTATFEGEAAIKAGSTTQIRAMKRRGGTIPGINQPKKQFNTMATTQIKDQLRKAGLSEEQIKALRGR